jgi:hypothetical protein
VLIYGAEQELIITEYQTIQRHCYETLGKSTSVLPRAALQSHFPVTSHIAATQHKYRSSKRAVRYRTHVRRL